MSQSVEGENRQTDEDFRASISEKKAKLTARPTIHQRVEEVNGRLIHTANRDRNVSWLELLFDLAIVTAGDSILNGFRSDVSHQQWSAPFIYIMKMVSILNIWGCVDNYVNRYGRSESLFDCCFILIQSIVIFGMSATMDIYADSDDDNHERRRSLSGFTIGIAFAHFFQLVAQLRVALLLPDSRAFSLSLLIHMTIWTVLWLVIGLMPTDLTTTWVVFTVATAGDFFREYVWLAIKNMIPFQKLQWKYIFIPMNIELAMHRAGLLVVIAIGEVTAAVSGYSLSAKDFGSIILAVILGFLMKFMYFDVFDCFGEDVEKLALAASRERAMAYLKLHIIAVLAIILCSYHLVPNDNNEDDYDNNDTIYNQMVFATSLVVAMMSMYFMGLLHIRTELHLKSQKIPQFYRTVFMVVMSAFMLLLSGFYRFPSTRAHIGVLEVLLGFCMFVEYSCLWFLLDFNQIDTMVNAIEKEEKEVPMQQMTKNSNEKDVSNPVIQAVTDRGAGADHEEAASAAAGEAVIRRAANRRASAIAFRDKVRQRNSTDVELLRSCIAEDEAVNEDVKNTAAEKEVEGKYV